MTQLRYKRSLINTLVVAIGALIVGSIAWFPIANVVPGRMTHVAVLRALGILLIAFLPLAFGALAGLAMFGVYFAYAIDYYATSSYFGPTAKFNSWPVAVIAAGCLAACWHGRSLLRRTVAISSRGVLS